LGFIICFRELIRILKECQELEGVSDSFPDSLSLISEPWLAVHKAW
jgi:hypothetical protein